MLRKYWYLFLLGLLVLIQLVPVNRTNPPFDPAQDFLQMVNAPDDIRQMTKAACYDCHSNETAYPWYAFVAPLSWWIVNHVQEGREHLNLSTFGALPLEEQGEAMGEMAENVEKGEMPLSTYPPLHPKAKLSDAQKRRLVEWLHATGPAEPGFEGEGEAEEN